MLDSKELSYMFLDIEDLVYTSQFKDLKISVDDSDYQGLLAIDQKLANVFELNNLVLNGIKTLQLFS